LNPTGPLLTIGEDENGAEWLLPPLRIILESLLKLLEIVSSLSLLQCNAIFFSLFSYACETVDACNN
jgi:hypothetical protein